MHSVAKTIIITVAASVGLAGCADIQDDSTRTKTEATLAGGGVGAAIGAELLGHQMDECDAGGCIKGSLILCQVATSAGDRMMCFDRSTLPKKLSDGTVRYWSMVVAAKGKSLQGDDVKSYRASSRVRCGDEMQTTEYIVGYSGYFGQGDTIFSGNVPVRYSPYRHGSIGGVHALLACQYDADEK